MVVIESLQQLCEAVSNAYRQQGTVSPVGGNTQSYFLRPMARDAIAIDMTRMNALIDYPHDDLTITVQAGMRMSDVKRLLQAKGQTLPIDVPQESQATVGGSIAANINGPRRMGWGTWRDYLIGLSWVNDQGEIAKAGGRVVKNVAGYDFCKLFTGSLGTLGIITQVTLKVKPIPEKCSLVRSKLADDQLEALGLLIRQSRLRPSLLVVESGEGSTWQATLGFEDSRAAVDWQIDYLREISRGILDGVTVINGLEASREIERLTEFATTGTDVSFEAHVPSSRCAEFVLQAWPMTSRLHAQLAIGVVQGHLVSASSLEDANPGFASIRKVAGAMGGFVTLCRCPAEWRKALKPWGQPRGDWPLMRKIAQTMDPKSIFQRGRYEIFDAVS